MNEDKSFFAAKLKYYEQIGKVLKDYLSTLNDLQRSCERPESVCSINVIEEIAAAIEDTERELDQAESNVRLAVLDLDNVLDENDETLQFLVEKFLLLYRPIVAIVEGNGPVKLVLPDDCKHKHLRTHCR